MDQPADVAVLVAEIRDEIGRLQALAGKLADQRPRLGHEEVNESAALRLHNFYTGCERVFRLIARDVNGGVPESPDWHRRLLAQMSLEIPDLRPAVVSGDTRRQLEELLAFRHVVRNLYGFELQPQRIASLVDLALALLPVFAEEVEQFCSFLEQAAGGSEQDADGRR